MDPESIALIMDALQFGAAGIAAGPLNKKGVELWDGLKTAIRHKFAGKPKAEMVLAEYEDDPDVWVEPLKKKLITVKADEDKHIMALARELKKLKDTQQTANGKFNTKFMGPVKGVVIGDHSTTTMNFNDEANK